MIGCFRLACRPLGGVLNPDAAARCELAPVLTSVEVVTKTFSAPQIVAEDLHGIFSGTRSRHF